MSIYGIAMAVEILFNVVSYIYMFTGTDGTF